MIALVDFQQFLHPFTDPGVLATMDAPESSGPRTRFGQRREILCDSQLGGGLGLMVVTLLITAFAAAARLKVPYPYISSSNSYARRKCGTTMLPPTTSATLSDSSCSARVTPRR
jgi:hypothetical protein